MSRTMQVLSQTKINSISTEVSQFAAWQCSDFVLDNSKTQQVSRKPPATKLLLSPFLTAFQLPVTGGITDGIQKVS